MASITRLTKSFTDPEAAARAAGLVYLTDTGPGLTRERRGKSFVYRDPRRRVIKDAKTLARIASLVIPPAWEKVWISPHPRGHIQAVGFDARGRKQYRYHPDWRSHRDLAKYSHVIAFAQKLPDIRRATSMHLRDRGLTRRRVLAATVRVMDKTLMRVGNDQYSRDNKTYGLSTLRNRHVRVNGSKVVFDFRAKHGIRRKIDFHDKSLADIIRKCKDLPGEELFGYRDDAGNVRDISSTDINNYLKEIGADDFTAKDFRTWAGTVLTANALAAMEEATSQRQVRQNILRAIERAAFQLGNTTAVCRKCYVHPAVLNAYMDGTLIKSLRRKINAKLTRRHLPLEEATVLQLLTRTLGKIKQT
jgi:DNA topoisomerase I